MIKMVSFNGIKPERTKRHGKAIRIDRFLCFFYRERKLIVINKFRKKQQKIQCNEKEFALKSQVEYTLQTKIGEYYDEEINVNV